CRGRLSDRNRFVGRSCGCRGVPRCCRPKKPGAREATMRQLILIRHGQAAAFTADSDRLTELGRRQAEKVGEHFLSRGLKLDEGHTGTLHREIESERIAAAA